MAASNTPASIAPLNGAAETITPYNENEVGAYAEQICNMLPFPMVMQAAIELDLFEIIAAEEKTGRQISAAEIADRLPAADKEQAADKLDRMLRLLAAFAVVTGSVDGDGQRVYGLSPVGRYFVRNEDGASFAPFLTFHQDDIMFPSWRKIKDAVIEGGEPFSKVYGMNQFDYSGVDSRYNQAFTQGMFNQTTVVMKKVIQHYKGFEILKQLVDVGGGVGHVLKIIVSTYPTLNAVNFDLPHVIEHGVSFPGVQHVSGDMFKSIPGPTEAIFMKWILHDWDDELCVKLLKNCYSALSNGGKVIILEHVLADEPETTTAAKVVFLADILMMTQTPKGRERTKKEFSWVYHRQICILRLQFLGYGILQVRLVVVVFRGNEFVE